MFLGMQNFDFAQILGNFPKHFRNLGKLPKSYPNLPKFCPKNFQENVVASQLLRYYN